MSPIDPKDVEVTRARMEADDVRASYGGLFRGKRAVITGVANDRSLAWAIAQAFHAEGAELAFTYQNERFKDRVEEMAAAWRAKADEFQADTCVPGGTAFQQNETCLEDPNSSNRARHRMTAPRRPRASPTPASRASRCPATRACSSCSPRSASTTSPAMSSRWSGRWRRRPARGSPSSGSCSSTTRRPSTSSSIGRTRP